MKLSDNEVLIACIAFLVLVFMVAYYYGQAQLETDKSTTKPETIQTVGAGKSTPRLFFAG